MNRDLDGRRALVTGGAGFIGSHLVDALLEAGAAVRVLDNLATGSRANLEQCRDRIEFLEGDLRDPAACRSACEGVDLVFHQAALGSVPRSMADPATSLAVNLGGTANLLTAARDAGIRRLVYASSSSVYGDSAELPKREGREGRVLSPYAASKKFCEEIAALFSQAFEVEAVGLRYFNVYGPRQPPDGPYAAVIPRFFRAALAGEPMVIHGDGEQSRDFTYVSDAVDANLMAASARGAVGGRAYNVAGGRRATVNEIARAIASVTGSEVAPRHEDERPGDVRHSLADLGRARAELGYVARVELAEGLARCREYYESVFAPSQRPSSRLS
jgi:nucleoside-diphosphate-sugar epimerase